MVNSQPKIDENKRITCVACGKLIATGGIILGKIKIPCKCGVMNTIGAEMKPEGRRFFERVDSASTSLLRTG